MLTMQFYTELATLLSGAKLSVAIGRGIAGWDRQAPVYQLDTTALRNEVFRKAVTLGNITFLDESDEQVDQARPHLLIQVAFEPGEGEGTIRECGLLLERDAAESPGCLLSYYTHTRIDKGEDMTLQRQVHVDFSPRSSSTAPGQIVTRYLGNSGSQEFHDLENEKRGCHINQIRVDRRIYFANPDQATAMNYDYCGHCFGRELSKR